MLREKVYQFIASCILCANKGKGEKKGGGECYTTFSGSL